MARRADQIYRFVAILRIHLPHYSLDMILYGKFRQVHVRRDFLICQSLRNKIHQLELPVGQAILIRSD